MRQFPTFYNPSDLLRLSVERGAEVAAAAHDYRRSQSVAPAAADRVKIAAFGIDCQIGFCYPEASLFVPGAVEDTQRAIEWIYRNLEQLTALHFSLDTHRVFQIFHPAWWVDANGANPGPFTVISHDDVRSGRWMPVSHPRESLEYTKRLETSGKYVLTIWPYHTLLGGVSHALVPALMEAAIFHALARNRQTHFETKGTHAMTENYSVLSPEVHELNGQVVGGFNAPFFRMLMEFDRIYIFGQAKSHCVLSTIRDLEEQIRRQDATLLDKIWILEDAMSPVPPPPLDPLPDELNFPLVAERAFERFKAAGMHIVKTSDPLEV
ncbi:MAG: nicotinamidase [Myxococcales bacterium]|nr:nicotinamidase [Myxococcales bacterium]